VSFAELHRLARGLAPDSARRVPLPYELLILGVYPAEAVD
jgi:hypothetical protein